MSDLRHVRLPFITHPVLSVVYEYLAIASCEYVYMNSLRALIAIWLDDSQTTGDGVRLNRSARE